MNQATRTFVVYLRVSTARQGRSGLGLEAQQAAIDGYVSPQDRILAPPFVEVESGRSSMRPKLTEALAKCRKTGATLLVAKLDRLSRNVPFLRNLLDSGVDVAFCDLPNIAPGAMGRFLLTQMASVAELEADLISERTKAALAAAKKRGVKLGGDRGYRPPVAVDQVAGTRAAAEQRSLVADRAAHILAPVLHRMREAGMSLAAMAAELAHAGVATPRGGAWTATGVRRALLRVGEAET